MEGAEDEVPKNTISNIHQNLFGEFAERISASEAAKSAVERIRR
jgi:hypothetical protein